MATRHRIGHRIAVIAPAAGAIGAGLLLMGLRGASPVAAVVLDGGVPPLPPMPVPGPDAGALLDAGVTPAPEPDAGAPLDAGANPIPARDAGLDSDAAAPPSPDAGAAPATHRRRLPPQATPRPTGPR